MTEVEQLELDIPKEEVVKTTKIKKQRKPRQGKRIPKTTVNPLIKDAHLNRAALQITEDRETGEIQMTFSADNGADITKEFNSMSQPEKIAEILMYTAKREHLMKYCFDEYIREARERMTKVDETTQDA